MTHIGEYTQAAGQLPLHPFQRIGVEGQRHAIVGANAEGGAREQPLLQRVARSRSALSGLLKYDRRR